MGVYVRVGRRVFVDVGVREAVGEAVGVAVGAGVGGSPSTVNTPDTFQSLPTNICTS